MKANSFHNSAVFLAVLSLALVSCSSETSFRGSAAEAQKKAGADATAKASGTSSTPSGTVSNPLPMPPVPPPPVPPAEELPGSTIAMSPDNPLSGGTTTVVAGEKGSIKLLKDGVVAGDAKFESSTLLAGSRLEEATGKLLFQTDLQDIGRTLSFTPSVAYEGEDFHAPFTLAASAPAITKRECSYQPPAVIGALTPIEKWHWSGWTPAGSSATYSITYSSPVVGDLDGDGNVEIVTLPSTGTYYSGNGPIVVLAGKTGTVLWNTLESLGQGAAVSTTPALIDLDADGYAEIVAVAATATGMEIIAFDYKTKTVKFRFSDGFVCTVYCMASVADIDGDGKPEIVAGNTILKNDGTLKARLIPAPESAIPNTVLIADVDPTSPGLELVVNGAQVYRADGSRIWTGTCRGYSAVSDIDRDGSQEVICIGGGQVVAYSSTGVLRWSKAIPKKPDNTGSNSGGAPNIGNFVGDADMEIGTAGGDYYVVYDKSGNELWKQSTTDRSSHRTGSTIFDFNGDGLVEVVYNDEQKLRIYDGATGAVLWETANPSGTLWEYPVIANVDDDASVEIIVSAPSLGGVRVFDDPTNLWVTSRKLWNQYGYYPEIISDKLLAVAAPGVPKQGFRVNTQGAIKMLDRILMHDLAALTPLFPDDPTATSSPDFWDLTFFVFNKGETSSPDHFTAQLFDDQGALLGSSLVAHAMTEGNGDTIKIRIPAMADHLEKTLKLKLNLNDQGDVLARECDVANNVISFKLSGAQRVTAP